MAQWRVWNKHPEKRTHIEMFRGEKVEIPADGYVLMDYEDAVQFKSQFFPMKTKATGEPDPAGFKVIRLQPHDGESVAPPVKFICHIDGREFMSQAMLDAYLKENYSESTFTDETIERELEMESSQQTKRGPGRPPKLKEQSA